jgi:hypothetical protein
MSLAANVLLLFIVTYVEFVAEVVAVVDVLE